MSENPSDTWTRGSVTLSKDAIILVKKNKLNLNDFVLLDSSCGYGNFLQNSKKYNNLDFKKKIGVDIDKKALKIAK